MKLIRQEIASETGWAFEPSAGSMGIERREKLRHERATNKRKALRDHRRGKEVRA